MRRCPGRSSVHRPLDFVAGGSCQPGRICRPRPNVDAARVGWGRCATPAGHRGTALAGAADADWWAELHRLIAECSQRAGKRIAIVQRLALHAGNLARMEYDFLFDETRNLLAIGYNVDDRRRDSSYYDLLASRPGCPPSWPSRRGSCRRRAGLPWAEGLTSVGGRPILLSWSGSMFEYLMPLLVMPTYEGTCLTRPVGPRWSGSASMEPSAGCVGHVGIRLQHSGTLISITSTGRSAYPAWD